MKDALRHFDKGYSEKERHERNIINFTNRKAPLIPAQNQADYVDQQARRAWRLNVLPQKVAHGLGYSLGCQQLKTSMVFYPRQELSPILTKMETMLVRRFTRLKSAQSSIVMIRKLSYQFWSTQFLLRLKIFDCRMSCTMTCPMYKTRKTSCFLEPFGR